MPNIISLRSVLLRPPAAVIEAPGTNLIVAGKAFDNAAWTKDFCTVNANSITDPDAGSTADEMVENAVGSHLHEIWQDIAKAASSKTYDFYVLAKETSGGRLLKIQTSDGVSSGVAARFDLNAGNVASAAATFGTGWTAGTESIVSLGSGWYRCRINGLQTNSATIVEVEFILDSGTGGSPVTVYTGDGAHGVALWDAVLEE